MTPLTPPACSIVALKGINISESSSRRPRPIQALECNPPDGAPWPAKCFNKAIVSYVISQTGHDNTNLDDWNNRVGIGQSPIFRQTRGICHTHMRDQNEIFTEGLCVLSDSISWRESTTWPYLDSYHTGAPLQHQVLARSQCESQWTDPRYPRLSQHDEQGWCQNCLIERELEGRQTACWSREREDIRPPPWAGSCAATFLGWELGENWTARDGLDTYVNVQ